MSQNQQDVLQFADLLARINEQVQLRDAFENDLPAYQHVSQMAGNLLGDEEGGTQPENAAHRELLELANNIHRLDYFTFKDRLEAVVSRIKTQQGDGQEGQGEQTEGPIS